MSGSGWSSVVPSGSMSRTKSTSPHLRRFRLRSRTSNDIDREAAERMRREFEEALTKAALNDRELRLLRVPPAVPTEDVFPALLAALQRNRFLVTLDLSGCRPPLSSHGIVEVLLTLHRSGNTFLRQLDLSGCQLDSEGMKQLCRYVRDHLHVTDLKFTDPFRDATSIVSERDIRSSRKIYGYLNANRSMYKFLRGETTEFRCPNRKIVVTQGFIKPVWASRLTCLDLTGNTIVHLSEFLQTLTLLTELHLSNNQLLKIPKWIGKLKRLRLLDLTKNSVRGIPEGVYELRDLRTLNLASNNIASVPVFLGHMPSLRVLSLKANPVTNVPTELIKTADHGDAHLLTYLRFHLDQYVLREWPAGDPPVRLQARLERLMAEFEDERDEIHLLPLEELPEWDCLAIQRRMRELQEEDFRATVISPLMPQSTPGESPRALTKDVCSALEPTCSGSCSCIAKVGDFIWAFSGTDIYIWDARTFRFDRIEKSAHRHRVTSVIEIPFPFLEAWSADADGNVVVYDIRKRTSMLVDVSSAPIKNMLYLPTVEEVWILTGASVLRYSVRTKGPLSGTVAVDTKVSGIVGVYQDVWIGNKNGLVSIYRSDGFLFRTFWAHDAPIVDLVTLGDYVWSTTTTETKVWKLQLVGFEQYTVSCVQVFSGEEVRPPLMAARNGEGVFSLSSDADSDSEFLSINQWSPSGEFQKLLRSRHPHSEKILDLTFLVSPDRLWSLGDEGRVCSYELKRGKKTIERMQNEANKSEESEDDSDTNLGVINRSSGSEPSEIDILDEESVADLAFSFEEARVSHIHPSAPDTAVVKEVPEESHSEDVESENTEEADGPFFPISHTHSSRDFPAEAEDAIPFGSLGSRMSVAAILPSARNTRVYSCVLRPPTSKKEDEDTTSEEY